MKGNDDEEEDEEGEMTRRMRKRETQGHRVDKLSRANQGWVGEQWSRAMALLCFLLFLVLSIPRYIAKEIQPLCWNLINE